MKKILVLVNDDDLTFLKENGFGKKHGEYAASLLACAIHNTREENRSPKQDYWKDSKNDAAAMAQHYLDEIVAHIVAVGQASDDYNNDYENGDSYHHESHVDRSYGRAEAAQVLKVLNQHEETDKGLWEGQDMMQALSTCAAYTYGRAVASEWDDLIERINNEAGDLDVEAENLVRAELGLADGVALDADEHADALLKAKTKIAEGIVKKQIEDFRR